MTTITQREFNLAIRAAFDAGVSWARQNPSAFDNSPVVMAQKQSVADVVASTNWNLLPSTPMPENEETPSEEKPKPLGGRKIKTEG